MFTKEEVIENAISFSDKFKVPREEIIILGGGALAIMGLREKTNDVDLFIPYKYSQAIQDSQEFTIKDHTKLGSNYWLENDTFDISDKVHERGSFYLGFGIQSLRGILALKLYLNREKDKNDIRLIKEKLGIGH